jgi:hypothetical protein
MEWFISVYKLLAGYFLVGLWMWQRLLNTSILSHVLSWRLNTVSWTQLSLPCSNFFSLSNNFLSPIAPDRLFLIGPKILTSLLFSFYPCYSWANVTPVWWCVWTPYKCPPGSLNVDPWRPQILPHKIQKVKTVKGYKICYLKNELNPSSLTLPTVTTDHTFAASEVLLFRSIPLFLFAYNSLQLSRWLNCLSFVLTPYYVGDSNENLKCLLI